MSGFDRVVVATRNQHKLIEVNRILHEAGLDVQLLGLADLDVVVPDVPETGETFAENAVLKAVAVSALTGLPALADDSGLCVDALNGMPGVLSARWAGGHGDDSANLDLVLAQLADVPAERRGARFVAAVAFVAPGADPIVREGHVDGRLLTERRGAGGFGYDPIFVPSGHELTTAEMAPEHKDSLSHRGNALRAMAVVLAGG